jgi:hypothetical protein
MSRLSTKMWEPQHLTALWVSTARYRDSFLIKKKELMRSRCSVCVFASVYVRLSVHSPSFLRLMRPPFCLRMCVSSNSFFVFYSESKQLVFPRTSCFFKKSRGQSRSCKLLLALARRVILGFEFPETHDHIILT